MLARLERHRSPALDGRPRLPLVATTAARTLTLRGTGSGGCAGVQVWERVLVSVAFVG